MLKKQAISITYMIIWQNLILIFTSLCFYLVSVLLELGSYADLERVQGKGRFHASCVKVLWSLQTPTAVTVQRSNTQQQQQQHWISR